MDNNPVINDSKLNNEPHPLISEPKLKFINIQDLYIASYNNGQNDNNDHNLTDEQNDISALADYIKTCGGLTVPLTVVGPDSDGKYEIISGDIRFKAVQSINQQDKESFKKLPCYIIGNIDSLSDEEKYFIRETSDLNFGAANQVRHEMDVVKAFIDFENKGIIKKGKTISYASIALGRSKRYASMCRKILENGCPELLDAVMSDKSQGNTTLHLTVQKASKIAAFDKDLQRSALHFVESGITLDEAISFISDSIYV